MEKKSETEEKPTAEDCLLHHCRNAVDRYKEIVKLIEEMLAARKVGESPSVAEVLAQREHQDSGTLFHALTNLIERNAALSEAVIYLLGKDENQKKARELESKIVSTQQLPQSDVES